MLRKHKRYARPRKPFDKKRIEDENEIKKKYGLKNKKEIWKADAEITKIRNRAKKLIRGDEKEKELFFDKLRRQGFKIETISDVLGLDKEQFLKRRLQTIVLEKKLAPTAKTARQFITHKHIMVNGKIVDSPSYLVDKSMEDKVTLKLKIKTPEMKAMEKEEVEEENA